MFERFTDRARHAVVLAQEEARRLNHSYIGTEHVLLGLLGEPEGVAAKVLSSFGVTRDGARQEVTDITGMGKNEPGRHIPFTPRAKKSMELALREALALSHNYIGTEHILLGLIRVNEGVAAQVLRNHGDLLAIRAAVLDAVPAGNAGTAGTAGTGGEPANAILRWLRRRLGVAEPGAIGHELLSRAGEAEPAVRVTPAGEAALDEAAKLAGTAPVGSQHLLLATLADADSAAARALVALGIDLDQARAAVRAADVTGTTDEQPEEAGRRQMSLQVSDEMLTLVLTDPVIVAAAKAALAAVHANAEAGETGEASEQGQAQAGTEGGAVSATVIRGDHPAAGGLAAVWLDLDKALEQIREHTSRPVKPGKVARRWHGAASQPGEEDDTPAAADD